MAAVTGKAEKQHEEAHIKLLAIAKNAAAKTRKKNTSCRRPRGRSGADQARAADSGRPQELFASLTDVWAVRRTTRTRARSRSTVRPGKLGDVVSQGERRARPAARRRAELADRRAFETKPATPARRRAKVGAGASVGRGRAGHRLPHGQDAARRAEAHRHPRCEWHPVQGRRTSRKIRRRSTPSSATANGMRLPVVFIAGECLGGREELVNAASSGELKKKVFGGSERGMERAMPEPEKDEKLTKVAAEKLMSALNRADEIGGEVRDFIQDKMATEPALHPRAQGLGEAVGKDFVSKDEVDAKAKAAEAKRAAVAAPTPAAEPSPTQVGFGDPSIKAQVFGKQSDPWSGRARTILEREKVDFDWVDVEEPEHEAKLVPLSTRPSSTPCRSSTCAVSSSVASTHSPRIHRLGQLEYALMSRRSARRCRAHMRASRSCRGRTTTKSFPPTKSRADWIAAVAGVAGRDRGARAPDVLSPYSRAMRTYFAIAILCASSMLAHADQLDDVLARNLAAHGGADKLRAIKSLRATGKVIAGRRQLLARRQTSAGHRSADRIRTEITIQGLTQSARATATRRGRSRRSKAAAMRSAPRSTTSVRSSKAAEFDGPLVDWRTKGHRIEYLGTEDVDGTPAIKLRVTRKDGDLQYIYLDPDTCLEIRDRERAARSAAPSTIARPTSASTSRSPACGCRSRSSPAAGRAAATRASRSSAPRPTSTLDAAWFRVPAQAPVRASSPPGPPTRPASPSRRRRRRRRRRAGRSTAASISGLGARNIGSAAMSGRVAAIAARQRRRQDPRLRRRGVGRRVEVARRRHDVQAGVRQAAACSRSAPSPIDPTQPEDRLGRHRRGWTRNSVSIGDGIYKSTDGGETWTNMGLPRVGADRARSSSTRRTATSSTRACRASCGATATIAASTRPTDGGKTWAQVLKGPNLSTGCSSVAMDPKNPDVCSPACGTSAARAGRSAPAATARRAERQRAVQLDRRRRDVEAITRRRTRACRAEPWGRVEVADRAVESAASSTRSSSRSDSALYRSNDGGATWEQRDRSQKHGLAAVLLRAPHRRSEGPGPRLQAGPQARSSATTAARASRTTGGGAHGDWHDLWIDPQNPKHVIGGDDGGLWISYDGGNKWWKANNLPVSQFYHVSVDNKDPVPGLRRPAGQQLVGRRLGVSGRHHERALGEHVRRRRLLDLRRSDRSRTLLRRGAGRLHRRASIAGRTRRATSSRRPRYNEKLRFNWNTPIAREPDAEGHALHRRAVPVPLARSRRQLGAHLARPRRPTIRRSRSRSSPAASPSTTRRPRCTRRSIRSRVAEERRT